MRYAIALLAGCLFGAGLLLSGMTDTQKVIGFLDLFGAWDPTLAFVMGGAIVPMAIAWRLTKDRAPVSGGTFPGPASRALPPSLFAGAALFGVGWGLVGLCPGPALAVLSFGGWGGGVFMLAMMAGMAASGGVKRHLDRTNAVA